jgi:hypothetical protein
MSTTDAKTAILRPDLIWAIRRFPFPLLAAFLATAFSLVSEGVASITILGYGPLTQGQIGFMLLLAFLISTVAAFATLRLSLWARLATQAVGFFIGLGIGSSVEPTSDMVIPFCVSMVCFITLGAGFTAGRGMAGAWLTALTLAANFALCLVALAILHIGGAIIFTSIETLLGFDTDDAYKPLLILAWFLAAPLFWLSLSRFCEDDPAKEQPVNLLHRIISVVTDGLLIPLVLILAGVIHLYAGRIALMLELPKGQIGWIVPTYLFIGYGVYLLAHTPGSLLPRLRRVFLRSWLFATLIPLALLGIAAAMRIEAYGITEERYLLALIVLGFALVAASVLVRRPLDLRILPLIGGALALVAAIGPLSAHNVTIYSQTARLRAIVSSVPPERWAQSSDGGLSEQQKQGLVSAMRELERRKVNLEQAAPSEAWPKELSRDSGKLAKELNVGVISERYVNTTVDFDSTEVTRLGPVILINRPYINWENTDSQTRKSGALSYVLQVKGNILEVSGEGTTTRFDLSSLLTQEKKPEGNGPRPVFQSIDGRKGELIVEQFSRQQHPTGSKLTHVWCQIALY